VAPQEESKYAAQCSDEQAAHRSSDQDALVGGSRINVEILARVVGQIDDIDRLSSSEPITYVRCDVSAATASAANACVALAIDGKLVSEVQGLLADRLAYCSLRP